MVHNDSFDDASLGSILTAVITGLGNGFRTIFATSSANRKSASVWGTRDPGEAKRLHALKGMCHALVDERWLQEGSLRKPMTANDWLARFIYLAVEDVMRWAHQRGDCM